ncbi:glycosyltransferase [Flavobacteriales bacterium]|nr:glycosyltransferase [Flavobacteriales bacterium]
MLISIIIPTYNRVSFLLDCVNSILNQTYSEFEIIIVSDGSTDNSKEEIAKLNDSRVKFIELDKNYGYPAKARNEGIKLSKGDFIAFCDDDDLWAEDKLKKQIEVINRDYNFVFSGYKYLDKSKSIFYKFYLNFIVSIIINVLHPKLSYFFLSITNPIVNSSVLVQKSLISKILFNESISFRASEDYQLWIQIYDISKPFYLRDELVLYRIHENNISSDFIANLNRCLLVFKNFIPKNLNQSLFKNLGLCFYSLRLKLKK